MEQNIEHIKKLIIQKIIKEIKFDVNSNFTRQLGLSDKEFNDIFVEAEKQNMSKNEFIKLIDEVKENLNLGPKIEELYKIIPTDLKIGQHLKLVTYDEKGETVEDMIFIGETEFLLIGHERGSLHANDLLKTITSPWNAEGVVDFEVYRNNKRVVEGKDLSIYRTRPIRKIQLLTPQFTEYENI